MNTNKCFTQLRLPNSKTKKTLFLYNPSKTIENKMVIMKTPNTIILDIQKHIGYIAPNMVRYGVGLKLKYLICVVTHLCYIGLPGRLGKSRNAYYTKSLDTKIVTLLGDVIKKFGFSNEFGFTPDQGYMPARIIQEYTYIERLILLIYMIMFVKFIAFDRVFKERRHISIELYYIAQNALYVTKALVDEVRNVFYMISRDDRFSPGTTVFHTVEEFKNSFNLFVRKIISGVIIESTAETLIRYPIFTDDTDMIREFYHIHNMFISAMYSELQIPILEEFVHYTFEPLLTGVINLCTIDTNGVWTKMWNEVNVEFNPNDYDDYDDYDDDNIQF